MTEAVIVLQRYGIAHRFLKLKHLLLSNKDNLKISGWTKSVMFWDPAKKKLLLQHKEYRARKNNYQPPEAFRNNYDPSKGDVWAIGVTLVNLCTHRYPFHVRAKLKFTKQWRMFVKKHKMNPIVRNLCNKIFVIDLEKRIKVHDIIKDDYFKVNAAQLINRSTRDQPLEKGKKSKQKEKEKSKQFIEEDTENATTEDVSHEELTAEEDDKKADEQQKEEEKIEQAEEAGGEGVTEATGEEGGEVGEMGEVETENEEEVKEITAPEETADKAEPVETDPGGEIKDVVDGTAAIELKDAVKDEGGIIEGEETTEEGGFGEEAAVDGEEIVVEGGQTSPTEYEVATNAEGQGKAN